MFRIVSITPGVVQQQYDAALARGVGQYRFTHVLGDGKLGEARNVGSMDALFESRDEFDAIVVHQGVADLPLLAKLVESGKHLLIDDPHCPLEILEVLHIVGEHSDATVACAQPTRVAAYGSSIREAVEAKQLGEPGLVRVHRWSTAPPNVSQESLQRRLWSMCFYELDLTLSLFDAVPQTVSAQFVQTEAPLAIVIHLGFERGMAILDCALHEGASFYTVSLIASQGAAYADDHHNTNLLFDANGTRGLNTASEQEWLHAQILAFLKWTDSKTNNSIVSMGKANLLTHVAFRSAEKSRVAEHVEAPELFLGCTYDL